MSDSAADSIEKAYDRVPYPFNIADGAHPDRIYPLAKFFGLKAADAGRARVLELGCGSGANLLSIAASSPKTECIGIDASGEQIAAAEKAVAEIKLTNIKFEKRRFEDAKKLGKFDYVIAHGLFSWIAEEDQPKLLEACTELLAPNGVAYVSYNTYPGWHLRSIARDMMAFHTRRLRDVKSMTTQARAVLGFAASTVEKINPPYHSILKGELDLLAVQPDGYLVHEHLQPFNTPVLFDTFARMADAAGLRYVGESNFATMWPAEFPREVQETLQKLSSGIVDFEQYLDFLRNRAFRQSLLCHKKLTLNRNISDAVMDGPGIAGRFAASPDKPALTAGKKVAFLGANESRIEVDDPLIKAAFLTLLERYPGWLTTEKLVAAARARLQEVKVALAEPPATGHARVRAALFDCYRRGLLTVHSTDPAFATEIADKPVASPLARWAAAHQDLVPTLRHERVRLASFGRALLRQLDGTRTRAQLIDFARKQKNPEDGKKHDPEEMVDRALEAFRLTALLIRQQGAAAGRK